MFSDFNYMKDMLIFEVNHLINEEKAVKVSFTIIKEHLRRGIRREISRIWSENNWQWLGPTYVDVLFEKEQVLDGVTQKKYWDPATVVSNY